MVGHSRSIRLYFSVLLIATCLQVGCGSSKSSSAYIGRWECTKAQGRGSNDFFEIKTNNSAFLITDESGNTYPGSLDDHGLLSISGVPLMDQLPLPIDSDTQELICSACDCNRFTRMDSSNTRVQSQDPLLGLKSQRRRGGPGTLAQ